MFRFAQQIDPARVIGHQTSRAKQFGSSPVLITPNLDRLIKGRFHLRDDATRELNDVFDRRVQSVLNQRPSRLGVVLDSDQSRPCAVPKSVKTFLACRESKRSNSVAFSFSAIGRSTACINLEIPNQKSSRTIKMHWTFTPSH